MPRIQFYLLVNSTPTVDLAEVEKLSFLKRLIKADLPTPESPTITTIQ